MVSYPNKNIKKNFFQKLFMQMLKQIWQWIKVKVGFFFHYVKHNVTTVENIFLSSPLQ